ncbi:THO complex subunit 5 protein [Dioscorea alata]|uniref:THO complex subunit 5 protein n=1 Tax=Dioscorea alata TaxID=55571 RepID=A0ACB7U5R6_DIOAL|nr:THO complex subunit 5 protein [Dioscorea alata]
MEIDDEAAPKPTPHELLEECRTAMEEIAAKMFFTKKESLPKSDLRDLVTQMSLLFITLRQVNRTILLEEDRIKSETDRAKAPVDFTTLQLHNLMYEKNHYLKAIKACKDFRSKHQDIELVPEEEFFRSAPEDIKGKVLASDGAHDLMLKRLNFELFQRKELCKLREKLEQQKKSLVDTINSRKKFLSSLPSHLKSLKKASLPVQQQLGILHSKKQKQFQAAELLPPPLYIIYSQLLAQKEAFGERIEIEILGSVKDAHSFALQQANNDNGTVTNGENNRLEDGLDEDEDTQRRRKRSKKNVVKDGNDQAGVHQFHPLKIILCIYDDETFEDKALKLVNLRFEYSVKLNVVYVGVEDVEEGLDDDILCNLFPDDTGLTLPHQTALYAGGSVVFGERRKSYPYKWAQHLAGMDILPEVPPLQASSVTSNKTLQVSNGHSGLSLYRHQNRVQTVLQKIRSRKKAQMALVEQLSVLRKLKWPFISYKNVPWALHTPFCTLHQWSLAGISDGSSSGVAVEQIIDPAGSDMDRRSAASWDEVEGAREDGELPLAVTVASSAEKPKTTSSSGFSDLEHSRSFSLLAKNLTPKKIKSQHLLVHKDEDDLELMIDSESDVEEQVFDQETEILRTVSEKPWEDFAAREFLLVLTRKDKTEQIVMLEAKVKISIEYPLRPPLFQLKLSGADRQGSWHNELRAMEAEVNLHILRHLPPDYENYILAHQVHCLAMLFDFQFESRPDKRKSSVIDVGLCEPVSGSIVSRSFRGRDRRKIISWKGIGCTLGYPY